MNEEQIAWPPPYIVRKHPRARSFKLRASKKNGLVITMPARANMREIPEIIEKHKAWITKHLLKFSAQTSDILPDKIEFRMLGREYKISYLACDNKRITLYAKPTQEIAIVGDLEKKEIIKGLLIRWIKAEAKKILIPRLEIISAQIKLPFDGANVRDQQTVWGSCTSKKAISLNYKLIFLPLDLAMHVMIHELCHTKHLNHSDRFWRLVATFDPNWEQHRKALKTADEFMPRWL